VAWHPRLYGFQTCGLCLEVSHWELFANILSLLFGIWQNSFSRHLRFMFTGEDRNKDPFKNWKLCGLWKLPFSHQGAIKLTQNCVCFINSCINLFVPTSVTREYHLVLIRLHLLQCISAHLQNAPPWTSWKTQYLNLFSVDFRSCLVAGIRKPIICGLKSTLLRRSTHAVPIRPQKANGSPASCTSKQ